jgi:hypothetical protein
MTRNHVLGISTVLLILIVATISTSQISSVTTSGDNTVNSVYAKYSNSQAQSLVNDCGIVGSSGINCANNGPQTLGDGAFRVSKENRAFRVSKENKDQLDQLRNYKQDK